MICSWSRERSTTSLRRSESHAKSIKNMYSTIESAYEVRHGQNTARRYINVFFQNQKPAGNLAQRWDKTGVVLEDMGFDEYTVKVD